MSMKVDRAQESGWPTECREERCSYFERYLRHGPATIPHAAYHAAERECDDVQRQCESFIHEHPGKELPAGLLRRVEQLEREVRA